MLRRLEIAFPVFWCWIAVGFMPSAFAETVELVTYYPAPGGADTDTNRLHARAATIGPPYSLTNPATLTDGTLLVADAIGIGPGFTATPPAGALHVVGTDDALDRVLFMPGADTGGDPGLPEIRVGIGTANPLSLLGLGVDTGAAGTRQAVTVGNAGLGAPTAEGTASAGDKLVLWNAAAAPVGPYKASMGLNADNELWLQSSGNNANNKITFYTSNASATPSQRMVIDKDGNVGIGTANPNVPLHVSSNLAANVPSVKVVSAAAPNAAGVEMLRLTNALSGTVGEGGYINFYSLDIRLRSPRPIKPMG